MKTIHDILKKQGLFVNDIKLKIKNGQIKLNGEVITNGALELNIEWDETTKFENLGDFVFKIIQMSPKHSEIINGMWAAGIEVDVMGEVNFTNDIVNLFKKVYVIRTSKREVFIIKKYYELF